MQISAQGPGYFKEDCKSAPPFQNEIPPLFLTRNLLFIPINIFFSRDADFWGQTLVLGSLITKNRVDTYIWGTPQKPVLGLSNPTFRPTVLFDRPMTLACMF